MNIYETGRLLDEYLLFHYGSPEETGLPPPFTGLPPFPVRSIIENVSTDHRDRALDLGCAVGRSTFELSGFCNEVVGIDSSSLFIATAERLRRGEAMSYQRRDEGRLVHELTARHPEFARPEAIRFEIGDAHALRTDLGDFQLVHAANLLCRLRDPQRLLDRLPSLVRVGGVLIITTPCSWMPEFTPLENWPPGRTLAWLEAQLDTHFALAAVRDQPFLIREHARKVQFATAQSSVWNRRPAEPPH